MNRWWIILPAMVMSAACGLNPAPPSLAPPADSPSPPPNPPEPSRMICEEENGGTAPRDRTLVSADTVAARPVALQTADRATWYVNNEPIRFRGRLYAKYGRPRVLGSGDIVRIGSYEGVPVFAAPVERNRPQVIYVPLSARCEFHAYQSSVDAGPVRGERRDSGR